MGGTPITAPVDPFEEAMRRKKLQEGIAGQLGGAPATAPPPAQTMPATGQTPQVDHLSVAKIKQSMGAQLSPEEEAALAAEALQQQAPATPAPAGGDPGYLQKFMQMIGLGG